MSDHPFHIVHTINGLRADHGGPSRSVGALATATRELGVSVEIVAGREPQDDILRPPAVPVHLADRPGGRDLLRPRSSSFGRTLADALRGGQAIVHDHGLWLPSNHISTTVASRQRVRRVVSARGMISDWALAQAARKKRVAWHLYQRRDLASAALIHATSEAEVAEAQRLGVNVPIARIPNGVEIPEPEVLPAWSTPPRRRALFLSRIHPKKGLMSLVDAWAYVKPEGWELAIAGPDEDGHQADVEQAAAQAGIGDQVVFIGPVADADKWTTYRSADLFVLPTHSENFGIVVAEALAAGVPVLTTRGAPWGELTTHQCGWWTEIGTDAIATALAEATELSTSSLRKMGERGRQLVEARYAWTRAAEQMIEAYAWVFGGGSRPDFVTDGLA
ncbi:MAG: glycosyltransferase [Rubricoccaceae bacterium]